MSSSGSLKRTRSMVGDSGRDLVHIEEHEEVMFEKDTDIPIPPVVSGKELMDTFGEATKIGKKMLPFNALIQVLSLKSVDISGPTPAIYMTGKILLQEVEIDGVRLSPIAKRSKIDVTGEEGEEEGEEDLVEEQQPQRRIISEEFVDYEGNEINDIINCTAPRTLARSWRSGATTAEHLEKGILILINELSA